MILISEISRRERRALLAFALLPVALLAALIVGAVINEYNLAVADHQKELLAQATGRPRIKIVACNFGSPTPGGFHFLSLFVVLGLIKPRRFFTATCLALFYAILVAVSIFAHVDRLFARGLAYVPEFSWSQFLSIYSLDVLGAVFAFPMLVWLLSIVWRLNRPSMMIYK